MCGIAGIADQFESAGEYRSSIGAMTNALRHRGPDGAGTEVIHQLAPAILFGHRRLAIIDLSPAGHQPMVNPDTGDWITFNGEIYNYRELRSELESLGQAFRTSTDTEVILKSYAQWGRDGIAQLRGIFAFAIWDSHAEALLLARDQLGVKPLYYWHDGTRLMFASEVRSVLASDFVPRKLDLPALQLYLAYGSVQEPRTMVAGVASLQPGSILIWRKGILEIQQYWKLPENQRIQRVDHREIYTELEARLHEAVRLQLVADVPLGAFLSGGIDSTAVAALAQASTSSPIKTFSVVFDEAEYDERKYARVAADHIGTDHAELHLSGEAVLRDLPKALGSFDQPSVDGLNTYFVSKITREAGLTVALSGLGGDEVFGGYDGYRKALLTETWGRRVAGVPRPIRYLFSSVLGRLATREDLRKFASICQDPARSYFVARRLFHDPQVARLLDGSHVSAAAASSLEYFDQLILNTAAYDPVNRVSALELQTYMLSTLLRDTDQMSMSHALEVRVPLIDHKLVEYLFTLPGDLKLDPHHPKPLLTRPLGRAIPDVCIHRPKRGFELPFAVWLRKGMRKEIRETLSDSSCSQAIGMCPNAVENIYRQFSHERLSWSRVWSIFVLLRWATQHRITT
jgi:asparagine synthase (glutamine-hydrolysing)